MHDTYPKKLHRIATFWPRYWILWPPSGTNKFLQPTSRQIQPDRKNELMLPRRHTHPVQDNNALLISCFVQELQELQIKSPRILVKRYWIAFLAFRNYPKTSNHCEARTAADWWWKAIGGWWMVQGISKWRRNGMKFLHGGTKEIDRRQTKNSGWQSKDFNQTLSARPIQT